MRDQSAQLGGDLLHLKMEAVNFHLSHILKSFSVMLMPFCGNKFAKTDKFIDKSQVRLSYGAASLVSTQTGCVTRAVNGSSGGFLGGLWWRLVSTSPSEGRKTQAGSAENRHSQMEGSIRYLVEGDDWLMGDGVVRRCVWGFGGVPASISLGHALDWEELAAGERPG